MICTLAPLFAVVRAEPPKVAISKENTYITAPLRADGVVDYFAWAYAPLKEIVPDDNAAVWLARALGPEATSPETSTEYYRLLGCKLPRNDGEYLLELE